MRGSGVRNNPEFARNLWLEFTPHRLVAIPAVIGALVFLGVLLFDDGYGEILGLWAVFGCGALLGLWGARLAAGSIADEAVNRTWDGQRLSALTPWEMTWGKFVGSTAIAWYGGLLCLAVYVSASAGSSSPRRLATSAASFVAGALLCQGVSFIGALIELRRGRSLSNRSRGAGGMVFALLLFWSLGSSILSPVRPAFETTTWYDTAFPTAQFLLVSIVLFAAWAIAGSWRLMREELQVQAPPLAWLAFTVFFMVYISGFWEGSPKSPAPFLDAGAGRIGVRLVFAYLSGIALLYFAAIFEVEDPVVFRRVIARWRAGGAAAALAVLPCWLATAPLVVVVGAAAAVASAAAGPATSGFLGHPAIFVVSCLGFVIRDLALLLAFNLGRNPKRADAAAFFYWVLLYGVFPTILLQLDVRDALWIFYPTGSGAAAILTPAFQAAAVLTLLRIRWRRTVSGSNA